MYDDCDVSIKNGGLEPVYHMKTMQNIHATGMFKVGLASNVY